MYLPTKYIGWWASPDGRLWSELTHRMIGEGKLNASGYHVVCKRVGGANHNLLVHSILCDAYHGPRPKGYQCNHKDCDKTNNKPDNLEWVTQKENMQHAWKNGKFSTWVEARWPNKGRK